jgi:hypothetical protein
MEKSKKRQTIKNDEKSLVVWIMHWRGDVHYKIIIEIFVHCLPKLGLKIINSLDQSSRKNEVNKVNATSIIRWHLAWDTYKFPTMQKFDILQLIKWQYFQLFFSNV